MLRLRFGLLAVLVLLIVAVGKYAEAAPIFFNFALDFNSGPLAGQKFPGTLSVDGDDCTGPCVGVFTPDGLSDGELLSFDVTVDGIPFTITDDVGFPAFPAVELFDNVITFVSYLATVAGADLDIFFATPSEPSVIFVAAGQTSTGEFRQVPEPTGLALFAVGLAALMGVSIQRRRAGIDNQP